MGCEIVQVMSWTVPVSLARSTKKTTLGYPRTRNAQASIVSKRSSAVMFNASKPSCIVAWNQQKRLLRVCLTSVDQTRGYGTPEHIRLFARLFQPAGILAIPGMLVLIIRSVQLFCLSRGETNIGFCDPDLGGSAARTQKVDMSQNSHQDRMTRFGQPVKVIRF